MDTLSKEKRHELMSKIRCKNSKIEVKVRVWLFEHGIRYRKNCKDIVGKPDIAIKKYKIAIFINGCFWHGHENCKHYRIPKTNSEYWITKIERNIARDRRNINELQKLGWNVFILWECQIQSEFDDIMERLLKDILKIKRLC